ncbi:MAG TPA: nucleotide exchange factor GrpE [Tepidisphaeraceae bacterium]|nr:nucleotide exchange factor GrpE [Tepidisphaeraceae bacterium]
MSDSGEMQEFQGVGVDEAPPEQLPVPAEVALPGELPALAAEVLPEQLPAPGGETFRDELSAPEDESLSEPSPVPAEEALPNPYPAPAVAALPDSSPPPQDEAPPDESPAPTDGIRARMMRQFEEWLDAMLADEIEPPLPRELIDEALGETSAAESASGQGDLLTLFSALTGLTGEIKLQGRAFKALTEALSPLARLPDQIEDMESAQADSTRQIERLARQLEPDDAGASALPPSKEILTVLFDLLERLERGLKTFEAGIASISAAKPHGLLARFGGGDRQHASTLATVQAMLEGYRLTASRLEAAIQQWGIQRVGKAGEMFDPLTMTAIEVDTASGRPTGTVVEVYRSGYVLHGQMLAVTQVKVAK